MTLAFRRHTAIIGTGAFGVTGQFLEEVTVTFPSNVNTADCALAGFNMNYTDATAHRLFEVEADTDLVSISGPDVRIRLQAHIRNVSGNIPYTGTIEAVVIADIQ